MHSASSATAALGSAAREVHAIMRASSTAVAMSITASSMA
jgi:hypothetical protein